MSDPAAENPYNGRDHESNNGLSQADLPAIAALVGTASGELKKIDERNVGDSTFTQALKMNPTQAVKSMIGAVKTPPAAPQSVPTSAQPPPPAVHQPVPLPPEARTSPPPAPSPLSDVEHASLESRILALEKFMETQKRSLKFKRGITYDITTSTIKGNFKNPSDILDIILTELAKNTKTITLKLCDANKTSK